MARGAWQVLSNDTNVKQSPTPTIQADGQSHANFF